MITPVMLRLNKELKKDYLVNLHESLVKLVGELYESKLVSNQLAKYHETFSDLIGLYSQYTNDLLDQTLTVSNKSGLPHRTKIEDLLHDKRKAEENVKSEKSDKELAQEIVKSIYANNKSISNILLGEFRKNYYHNKLKKTDNFENVESFELNQSERGSDIDKYVYEFATYSVTDVSCISIHVDLSRPKKLFKRDFFPKKKIRKAVSFDVEAIYAIIHKEDDDSYPGIVVKTQIENNFFGKDIKNEAFKELLDYYRTTSILDMHFETLENLDAYLSENHNQLKLTQQDENSFSDYHLFICDKKIEEHVKEITTEQGIYSRVIAK